MMGILATVRKWRHTVFATVAFAAVFFGAATPAPAQGSWSDVEAAAKREGALTFYHNMRPAGAEPFLQKFREAHPEIRAEQVRLGSAPLIERFATEFAAGRHIADVVLTFPDERIYEGMKQGWMEKWTPPELGAFPASVNIDNQMFAVQTAREAIVYNKNRVKRNEIPTEWTDLFDPKYKGRIGMNPPWRSVAVQQVIAFWQDNGIKDAAERLKANNVRFFEGSGGIMQAVIRGDIDVAHITDLPVNPALADGAPIGVVYPKSGTTLSNAYVFVARRAPHPNAAKVFVNWLMTREGQEALQTYGGLSVTRKDAPPLSHLPATSQLSNAVDGEKLLTPARQKQIVDHWRQTFGIR
ncbi:MAG TPA: extracellular solute-binding protein [Thermodesulfobacteriota bacterium]